MNYAKFLKFKYIVIGMSAIGMLIFTSGLVVNDFYTKNYLFLVGIILLGVSSFLEKELFFSSMQCVLFINTILTLCKAPLSLNIVTLCILGSLTFLMLVTYLKVTVQLIIGMLGFIFLSSGIIFASHLFMLFAGIFLLTYSCFSIRDGFSVGWIFMILNLIFITVTLMCFF